MVLIMSSLPDIEHHKPLGTFSNVLTAVWAEIAFWVIPL